MALRITPPNIDDTEKLLVEILSHTLHNPDFRILFLVPAGSGRHYVARLRVMISRKRKRMEQKGRKQKQFRLNSCIHPETHSGIRHDAIVMWTQRLDSHVLTEALEDILGS